MFLAFAFTFTLQFCFKDLPGTHYASVLLSKVVNIFLLATVIIVEFQHHQLYNTLFGQSLFL
jgi:hypothetical protein